MERAISLGLDENGQNIQQSASDLRHSIALKLSAMGYDLEKDLEAEITGNLSLDVLARYREQARLLRDHQCPADRRIQGFLNDVFAGFEKSAAIRVPTNTLVLDRHGLARELSVPSHQEHFQSSIINSYRLDNGVLHNPASDRRTTQGVFHIVDFGLPVPFDKPAVPVSAFFNLLDAAFHPPEPSMVLPFTSGWRKPVGVFVSLLLRPLVCPEVFGSVAEKRTELRFFVPGSLVANLDFVESIFGNAGDPHLPANDASLDVDHWTGHTGCVVLAPHLTQMTKKQIGLPSRNDASQQQRDVGMCWNDPQELYNDGAPFKICCRDARGVMVTIITDNYFGYCKKEVKTQISYSANLWGLAEEEHAGGALVSATYRLGDEFRPGKFVSEKGHNFEEAIACLGNTVEVRPQGYAVDRLYPDILFIPEDACIDLHAQRVRWTKNGEQQELKLLPERVYIHPSGYRLRLEQHARAPSWHLIGTVAEGVLVHKPCTVSGGGKSEISKSMESAILGGPFYVQDFVADMAKVKAILERDYSDRLKSHLRSDDAQKSSRPILAPDRSLGSVIKMLTPSCDFTDDYNEWLATIPDYILAIVFIVKRFYQPSWVEDWQAHFSVDLVNGSPGHELKYENRKLVANYARVGFHKDGSWRIFKLRQDFICADKVQMEDDISASVTVPSRWLKDLPDNLKKNDSVKVVENCEWRLFQRPDDAIHPGYDKQTERDMSEVGLFASNFEPLSPSQTLEIVEDVFSFAAFTAPMADKLQTAAQSERGYTVCSARPRIVDGKPSKNPRYLQTRPDVAKPRERYLVEVSARLHRRIKAGGTVPFVASSVISGRRNNPPQEGIRPLCAYNPLHYQELPELFMDYMSSLTGKSPSTTGAGSEGALTKGPFNALPTTIDLNNALVSMILCGHDGFSTSAGWIGPHYRVDHDISFLIPEIWCRLSPQERNAAWLIENGHLERMEDFEFEGKRVLASRLGYRINQRFVRTFLGRVFDNPNIIFTEEMLAPEKQDLAIFVDAVKNIVEAQTKVAKEYLSSGASEKLCPPLRALVHVMVDGTWQGQDVQHPDFRRMFAKESLLESSWYEERLLERQKKEKAQRQKQIENLNAFVEDPSFEQEAARLGLNEHLTRAKEELRRVDSPGYLEDLAGTIGSDPM